MKNHVAFITGGSSGIGYATALAFAKRGAHISLMGLNKMRMNEAKVEIEKLGVTCFIYEGDVTEEEDVINALHQTHEHFGALNYAFNNAGIEQNVTPLIEQTTEDYQLIVDTNVKGTWLCMKHQIPYMLKAKRGCIVNTSSAIGLVGFSQLGLFVATQHAIIGLTKSAALEFAKSNIRVNAICPGAVQTPLYHRFTEKNPQLEQAVEQMHPIGRTSQPEEIAAGVLWLCSADASFVTGHALSIDGGYTAQ